MDSDDDHGAVENPEEVDRVEARKANRREDWARDWRPDWNDLDEMSPTYPRDGRDTIFEEYEKIMPTRTVAEYLAADQRTRDRDFGRTEDPDLPDDFGIYLRQRVPSNRMILHVDPETVIDRRGQLAGKIPRH